MTLHHAYMTAMSILFVAVYVVIIHSLTRHRQRSGAAAAQRFGGPTGSGQWLWALVPLLILAGVDVALLDVPGKNASPTAQRDEAPRTAAAPGTNEAVRHVAR